MFIEQWIGMSAYLVELSEDRRIWNDVFHVVLRNQSQDAAHSSKAVRRLSLAFFKG